jgi:hypothetical protein
MGMQHACNVARRARGRRLVVGAVAGSTLIAGVGAASLALSGVAGAATGGSTGSGAAACPTASGSNIAFTGTLSDGTAVLGGAAKVSGLSGSVCGLADLSDLTATIQPANFNFSPVNTVLFGFLPLPTTMTVTKPASAALVVGSTAGTYDTSMQVSLDATSSILGLFTCQIGPFSPDLTTGTSGSVSGTPLTGSLVTSLSGTLAAGDFSVPTITPSSSCPSFVAGLADLLIGLPLAPGKSTITTKVTLTPELPGVTTGSSSTGSSGTGSSATGSSGSSSPFGGFFSFF